MLCFDNVMLKILAITSVSAVGLVGGFVLNPADSGFSWMFWRNPAAAGFRRTRQTLVALNEGD